MAARSNSKEDVYEWIWSIICSCENNEQLYLTSKLIRLFEDQHNDKELATMLKDRRMVMWDKLYNQKKNIILKG